MTDDINPNKIAAEFMQANLDNAFELVAKGIKGAKNIVKSKFERTYSAYIKP